MMGRCFSLSPLAGEGRGEEPLSTVSDSRKGPLTRNLRDERADSYLSSPSKAGVNALMGKRGEVLGVGLKRLPIPQPGKVKQRPYLRAGGYHGQFDCDPLQCRVRRLR